MEPGFGRLVRQDRATQLRGTNTLPPLVGEHVIASGPIQVGSSRSHPTTEVRRSVEDVGSRAERIPLQPPRGAEHTRADSVTLSVDVQAGQTVLCDLPGPRNTFFTLTSRGIGRKSRARRSTLPQRRPLT